MSEPENLITVDRIKAVCPNADHDIIEAIVTAAPVSLPKAGLNDPIRLAHFIAQIATETGGLRRLDEDLNYTAARLVKVFPRRFKSVTGAQPYVRNPEKLANFVYGGRNGNKEPGDGFRYRGSGLIQLTGRGNFDAVGNLVGMNLVDNPELARHADSALEIALGYWTKHKINSVAGTASDDAVKAVTKLINPALQGLDDRKAYFKKAIRVFGQAPVPAAPAARKPVGAKRPALEAAAPQPAPAPQPATMAPPPPTAPELSGRQWTLRFPTSRDIADLDPAFARELSAFLDALRVAGARVDISATYRPKERAYLMHWAWEISKGHVDPAKVSPMPGVGIQWDHGSPTKSRAAAREMAAAFGMAFTAALNSRHTEKRAIDMTISWSRTLSIKKKDGTTVNIATQPRNGGNPQLVAVGAGYGVIKLVSDPPHWSDDGR